VSLRSAARAALRALSRGMAATRIGRAVLDEIVDSAMLRTHQVVHQGTQLTFAVPNRLAYFRIATFSTKEPETLAWIDAMPRGAVLWDIGANVGLYTCYAARARGCRVVAFEPSVFNLELLARNVCLNELTQQVTLVPLPLSDKVSENTLNMTSTQWGGALSSFGVEHGFDGQPLEKVFEFRTVGTPGDLLPGTLSIPIPDFIKVDVDGIEHLVLRGCRQVLERVRGVQVEVNDAFKAQSQEVRRLLEEAGLQLISKTHSELMQGSALFNSTFNQVWAR
jgi:FkbM family methyltransferase